MSIENDYRPICVRLGRSWAKFDELIEVDFTVLPRIGEAMDLMLGMETPRTLRVIDIKHSIIDDLQMTEVLVWPADLLE